jgi:hypothetical protein
MASAIRRPGRRGNARRAPLDDDDALPSGHDPLRAVEVVGVEGLELELVRERQPQQVVRRAQLRVAELNLDLLRLIGELTIVARQMKPDRFPVGAHVEAVGAHLAAFSKPRRHWRENC